MREQLDGAVGNNNVSHKVSLDVVERRSCHGSLILYDCNERQEPPPHVKYGEALVALASQLCFTLSNEMVVMSPSLDHESSTIDYVDWLQENVRN